MLEYYTPKFDLQDLFWSLGTAMSRTQEPSDSTKPVSFYFS